MKETALIIAHPKMFRTSPLKFILLILLCIVIIGIPFILFWYIRCRTETLTVTTIHATLTSGVLSKSYNEVRISDIRNIQITQTFLQRTFNVGDIGISTAAQSGIEIIARGYAQPYAIKQAIESSRA